ncbi:glycerophosphoryl diester phosphodiesterase membrane domain-containing protein [Kaistia dalseonensis]|uniref:Glycerophosphoryl diester phosphodiesterase n=1 Tax=Kaistia dalseonensis TaxID=410840 RepID=A0ABU0H8G2_9HYPH|nr:glycerophosphodiester phosphodiesterase family protein [Kaistia dalseonensis]MCX5496001.1 glycerophosphoryl diester phosphodiesterase membrane domain-containing protein [Kaistia dalseonensis]MDQ0438604.1 glycerophosphoryl diester phosphodiesterase [Kaistia dalseonensis]
MGRSNWTAHWPWLKRVIGPLILFEAGIGLVMLLVLDPLVFALLQAIIALADDPFTGNDALIGFFLSPLGFLTLATAAIVTIALLAVDYGGASLIVRAGIEGERLRPARIAARLVRRLPVLIGIAAILFISALGLFLPVAATAFAAKALLLSDADIYFYVTVWPPRFVVAVALVGFIALLATAAAFWLALRWCLAVPIALMHDVSPVRALALSAVASAGRRRRLALRLLGWGAGWLIVSMLVASLVAFVNDLMLSPQNSLASLARTGMALVLVNAVAISLVASLARAALAVIATHFYLADGRRAVPSAEDHDPLPARFRPLRWAVIAALCLALPVISALQLVWTVRLLDVDKPVSVTAHRAGSIGAPENTLAALEKAIAAGAQYAEIDVQETLDGEVIVLHDTDLRRVAGLPRSIWQLRYDEIRDLDVGSWFDPAFAAERVPTLRAFALAAKGRIKLNIEMKANGHGVDLAGRTIAVLRETGMEDEAVVSSLDLRTLQSVRRIDPVLPVGFIVATGLGNLAALDVDFYAIAQRFATPGRIKGLNQIGRAVHVWKPDTAEAMVSAMLDGADNLITDDPGLAIETIRAFHALGPAEQAFLRVRSALLRGRQVLDPARWAPMADY